jgi:hypothetical protein
MFKYFNRIIEIKIYLPFLLAEIYFHIQHIGDNKKKNIYFSAHNLLINKIV